MKTLRFIFPLLYLLIAYCALPVDPLENYSNCTVTITGVSDNEAFYINDTVEFDLTIGNPHLIDTLTLSFGELDTILVLDKQSTSEKTFHFTKTFTVPDTVVLASTALKGNQELVTTSVTIVVIGYKPDIVTQSKNFFLFKPGFTCTLSVAATGSMLLYYQWFKNSVAIDGATRDSLILPNVRAENSGDYYCKVWNDWGADSSTSSSVVVSAETGKTVYWKFGMLRDTVNEGETALLRIDSLYVAPAGDVGTMSVLYPLPNVQFLGDSLFTFSATLGSSGVYTIPVAVSTRGGADTAQIVITVLRDTTPFYVLTLFTEPGTGSIQAQPAATSYRSGDTVTLTALPKSGYTFGNWIGAGTGSTPKVTVVITENTEISAVFIPVLTPDCVELTTGSSLNTAIQEASPSAKRPGSLCPAEGMYDNGTINVWGNVRFIFQ